MHPLRRRQGTTNLFLLTKHIRAGAEQRGEAQGGITSDVWQKVKPMTAQPRSIQRSSAASESSSVSIIVACLPRVVVSGVGSGCGVINGSGRSRSRRRPARRIKVRDWLSDAVRSNRLKRLSARRYWYISPGHDWQETLHWELHPREEHSDCLSLRLYGPQHLKIRKKISSKVVCVCFLSLWQCVNLHATLKWHKLLLCHSINWVSNSY